MISVNSGDAYQQSKSTVFPFILSLWTGKYGTALLRFLSAGKQVARVARATAQPSFAPVGATAGTIKPAFARATAWQTKKSPRRGPFLG